LARQQQVALLGLAFALLQALEMFGATLNRVNERQFDITPANQGVFNLGTLVNYTLDSLLATLLAAFLLALCLLLAQNQAAFLPDALQIGVGLGFLVHLLSNLIGNYNSLFEADPALDTLYDVLEIILAQLWYWVMGLTFFGLARSFIAAKNRPLALWTGVFGLLFLGLGMSIGAQGTWTPIADLMRYIGPGLWAAPTAALLWISPPIARPLG
jgi:hypothetical protein